MTPDDIIKIITSQLEDVKPKSSWGETSLFYNPQNKLPNGVYFCAIKEKDGGNDKSSDLSRKNIFRLSIGIPKNDYIAEFGDKPKPPEKGGIVTTGHDFTQVDVLMPHPIYAWMSWVCILSPSRNNFENILPLINKAHANAMIKFDKKIGKK
ncbi:MAG: DUF6194 family protein [Cocleimonas sp.]